MTVWVIMVFGLTHAVLHGPYYADKEQCEVVRAKINLGNTLCVKAITPAIVWNSK